MNLHPLARTSLPRLLLAASLLAGLALTSPGRASPPVHAATVSPGRTLPVPFQPPSPPTISHLNTDTAHYITDTTGLVHVQLYTSPVATNPGPPAHDTWQFRTPTLIPSGASLVSPSTLPFHLSVAIGAPQADLVSEDGVDLHLGVATINGAAPVLQPGLAGPGSITYPASGPGQPSVRLLPTISGLDLQVTLPQPVLTGSVVLTLAGTTVQTGTLARSVEGINPTAPVQVVQGADGIITIQRPQQLCGSQGCQTVTAPSLYIEPPQVHDTSAGALAAVQPGPASVQVTSQGPTGEQVTISLDPSWLAASARVWPVHIDMPVVTASSAAQSGVSGTLQSCAPTTPAQGTRIVVGSIGSCTDHGLLYFPLDQLFWLTSTGYHVVSATLQLNTPTSTGPTGVLVAQNAPGELPPTPPVQVTQPVTGTFPPPPPLRTLPTLPVLQPPAIQTGQVPTWTSAPAVLTGTQGLAQTNSAGQAQGWDVTGLVQHWLSQRATNTGITLVPATPGAVAVFAAAADVEGDSPAQAPQLDLTLAPNTVASTTGSLAATGCTSFDCAATPWGLNGGTVPSNNDVEVGVAHEYFGSASLYRVPMDSPTGAWTPVVMPCGEQGDSPTYWQPDYNQMEWIYAAGKIPVLTFQVNPNCYNGNPSYPPTDWFAAMVYFSYYMQNLGCVTLVGASSCTNNPPMYFEIGNEVDTNGAYAGIWPTQYPQDYANAAQGLYWGLVTDAAYTGHLPYTNVHILTAGQDAPNDGSCSAPIDAAAVMAHAEGMAAFDNSGYDVPTSVLATAIHPYSYQTNGQEPGYWQNMQTLGYTNTICDNLAFTILHWEAWEQYYLGDYEFPVIMSEINYTASGSQLCGANQSSGVIQNYLPTQEGSYNMDLFTWLIDHYIFGLGISNGGSGVSLGTAGAPVRTIWYRTMDSTPRPPVGSACPSSPPDPSPYSGMYQNNLNPNVITPSWVANSPLVYYGEPYAYLGCTSASLSAVFPKTAPNSWSADLSAIYFLTGVEQCY